MAARMQVIKPGPLTSVQDAGRPGYLGKGIPPAGALDNGAFRVANQLVGNDPGGDVLSTGSRGAAVLECTMSGPQVVFDEDVNIAVTGGEATPKVDGDPIPQWACVTVRAGQVLDVGAIRRGLRTYLAVGGGFDVKTYLGSRSTLLSAGLGGHQGRAVRAADQLPLGHPSPLPAEATAAELPLPVVGEVCRVRVHAGPQAHLFTEESLRLFHDAVWKLTPMSNRMGSRFVGPTLEFLPRPDYLDAQAGSNVSNIVDDIIPIGGVQCPDGAAAIVMNAEHPTAGGYAKIASIVAADLRLVAQMRPGQEARFELVESAEGHR